MTELKINDVQPRRQYTATSGQTAFTVPFEFFEDANILAYKTPAGSEANDSNDLMTLTSDYTLSGAGATGGGTLTLVTGATTGDVITIELDVAVKRTSQYQNTGDLLPETLNEDLNKLVSMVSQQESWLTNRALSFPRSEVRTASNNTLPTPANGQYLQWNNGAIINATGPTATVNGSNLSAVNIASLRSLSGMSSGDICTVAYHTTKGWGGGIYYYIDGAAASTYTDNNGTTIVPSGGDGSTAWLYHESQRPTICTFGAIGDGVEDCYDATIACITYVADLSAATSRNPIAVVWFPIGDFRMSDSLPIITRMAFIGEVYRGCTIQGDHAKSTIHSATYSSGVFTDNLNQAWNGTALADVQIKTLALECDGNITGNAPSGGAWNGHIHLVNTRQLEIDQVRVDGNGDDDNFITLYSCWFTTIRRPVVTCPSSHSGGFGIYLFESCNNVLIERMQIAGGFEVGIELDGGTTGMDSVTVIEGDFESIDWLDDDGPTGVEGPTDSGVAVGLRIGGTNVVRISNVKIDGFFENADVQVQLGTSTTGAYAENFRCAHSNHGNSIGSRHVYKLVNTKGHEITLPRMAGWNVKRIVMTSMSGTPTENDIFTGVDRFGNTVKGVMVGWDAGTSTASVAHLWGDIDPASAVTFVGSGETGTVSSYTDHSTYGSDPTYLHFDVDSGGQVRGGTFNLPWSSAHVFKPADVGLNEGTGVINVIGYDNTTATMACGGLFQDLHAMQIPQYYKTDLDETTIDAGVVTHKIICQQENIGEHFNIRMFVNHTCRLTSSSFAHNSTSFAEFSINIVRAWGTNDAVHEVTMINETYANTGTLADCAPIVATCVVCSNLTGTGELEIDVTFTPNSATPANTTNELRVSGTIERYGPVRIQSATAA